MSLVRVVRLRVPAAAAKPGPAIGQALGPLGINMMEFCKQFNERTEPVYERETPLSVSLSAMSDRTFKFVVKSPPTSYLLKKAAGLAKGATSPSPGKAIGFVTPETVYEIAKVKQQDDLLWHLPLESIARSVVGTAKSIGIAVQEFEE
ncbi:ribosomal uL11-like protein [Fragilaria crotonensis]|nr:ribosomal uL11-like protein [Fragilaria crotonensis]